MPDISKIQQILSDCRSESLFLKLAETEEEIVQAKKLRYFVFFEEPNGATAPVSNKIDEDEFDSVCQHLLVVDKNTNAVVGTYRLLYRNKNKNPKKFYTESEFDISKLKNSEYNLLELGRSCIHPEYRTGRVIQLLWKGIGAFISYLNIDYLFGCASFQGVDAEKYNLAFSYLFGEYLADGKICPSALTSCRADVKITEITKENKKEAFNSLPALLKGYIRAGCKVGEGVVIDNFCKTLDVCIVMDSSKISKRYSEHFVEKK